MKQRERLWTPGPWWIEKETGDMVAKDGDWEICTFSRSDSHQPYDTQLISAAPDLVEALEQMLSQFGGSAIQDMAVTSVLDQAEYALAKAYGDSQ